MGPSGDIAATWIDAGDGVHASSRAAYGSSSEQLLSAPEDSAGGSSVAVSASGTVVVAWVDHTTDRYQVAIHRRGEAFLTRIDAGPTGGTLPDSTSVAIDNAGDVLVGEAVEASGGYKAVYAWLPAGSSFSETTISEASNEPSAPVVAMDGAGDAVIAWYDKSAGPHDIARVITRPAGGAFSAAQNLTASGPEYDFNVAAAIGAGGQPAVIWQRGGVSPPYTVEASTSPGPSDPLGAPQVISPPSSNNEYPAIAVGGNGEVVATWEHWGTTNAVDAASAMAGVDLGAATAVSAGGSVGVPRVATDAAGNAVIAWGIDSLGEIESIDAVTRAAGGTVSPEIALSAPKEKIDPLDITFATTVGMDSAGDALVGWEGSAEHTIMARVYDASGPLLKLEVPATSIAGQSVTFTSSAKDLFAGVGSTTWSFGDGAGATGISPSHIYTAPGTYTVFATATDLVGNTTTEGTRITVLPAPTPPLVACATGSSTAGGSCPPAPLPVRCHVPSLKGLSSSAAEHRLSSAHCRAGKVNVAKRYRHSKRLVVSAQSVRAGTTLPFDASVSLTLKPAPPQRHKHRR